MLIYVKQTQGVLMTEHFEGPPAPKWRNRIVGYGDEDPEQLLANPSNWRIHPKFQQDALTGVLDEIGWVDTVIVNKTTGFVVDGHLRVTLAISNNEPKIPVCYVDLTPAEEATILATFDPITMLAVTDQEQYNLLVKEAMIESEHTRAMMNDILMGNHGSTPSLDDLAREHGDPDSKTFWPVIRVQISPEANDKLQAIKLAWGMDDDEAAVIMEMITRIHALL